MADYVEKNIHRRLQHDDRISVEYGVPLESIPYRVILRIEDDLMDSEAIDERAAALVEQEALVGRFGAFVTRTYRSGMDVDIIEVWSWAD